MTELWKERYRISKPDPYRHAKVSFLGLASAFPVGYVSHRLENQSTKNYPDRSVPSWGKI